MRIRLVLWRVTFKDSRELFTLSLRDTGTISFIRIITKLPLSYNDYPYITVNSIRDIKSDTRHLSVGLTFSRELVYYT